MRYIALLLLFLVACSLPQPVTEDTVVDVSESEKSEPAKPVEKTAAEPVKKDAITSAVVVESEKVEDQVEVVDIKTDSDIEESDDAESDDIQVKVSPITNIVAESDEDKLALGIDNVMDYLVEIFAKDVHSYSFRNDAGSFFVMGDKFKLILNKPVRYIAKDDKTGTIAQHVISTVYVDRKLKTATGYCEGKDTGLRRECEDKDILDTPRDLIFSDYNFKLPEDWLWEFLEKKVDAVETEKYYVNSKKTIRVLFASENETALDLFFDEKTGLPVRIISIKDGEPDTYDFRDLNANKIKKFDVIHRDLSEIPSSEYFE